LSLFLFRDTAELEQRAKSRELKSKELKSKELKSKELKSKELLGGPSASRLAQGTRGL
jgi:hypothetical protein